MERVIRGVERPCHEVWCQWKLVTSSFSPGCRISCTECTPPGLYTLNSQPSPTSVVTQHGHYLFVKFLLGHAWRSQEAVWGVYVYVYIFECFYYEWDLDIRGRSCFSLNTSSDCRVKKSDIVWNFKITAEILFADESNIQTNRISMTPKRDSFLSLHLTSISSSVLRSVHSCSHFLFTNFLPNLLVTSELCGVLNFHHDLSIWVDDVYSLVTLAGAGECLLPLS